MKKPWIFIALIVFGFFFSCSSDDAIDTIPQEEQEQEENETGLYFPPLSGSTWETSSITELGWNTDAEQELYDFLEDKGTKAFLILKDGIIAVEWYAEDHNQDAPWYWASAGKTLTSFTTGIAQAEGYLSLSDKTSDYLGTGWTSTPLEKENLITVWHQLTMTSGMDDTEGDCKTPACLTYVADAGTRWSYHNAPYTLLQDVVSNATQVDFEAYFNEKLKTKIGMTGQWLSTNGDNNVYWSTARSMARFGLLALNEGVWDEEAILGDADFINGMKTTSQELNQSYGYLWWLNGKESAMLPNTQIVFETELMPAAPDDLFAGLGKNDQKLYVVPSQNLVVVRMGEDTGEAAAGPSGFDNQLWEQLNAIID
ncbi:serine hydrolase domain-containing protein [Maribacter halichondriae]|uniref:serine hydrolase domain-containing protein n=1 Tax=Maribacter halichondriae TaxID=2980554 RepID=UPI0023580DBF|nr:serine hydrolase [Maribacter sp. Hal144]